MVSPIFQSTSSDKPKLLTISFESDPSGSLGAQLNNMDKGLTEEMFIPGYATVGRLIEGDTVAKKSGVHVADCIVAVNKQGFRRFAPDYEEDEVEDLSAKMEGATLNGEQEDSKEKARVLHESTGENYKLLLAKIKEIKGLAGNPPLTIHLERYGWDARPNSWQRYLAARDGDVPAAMAMIQQHEQWRTQTFPIDLTDAGLQHVLKLKAVCEIDIESPDHYPTVYVNYSKLQSLEENTADVEHVVQAFLIFTEMMLSRHSDPRHPKTCQFIDLTGVKIGSGFRVDILKKIYQTFEPNYPETLHKMVMYPVSKTVAYTSKMLLSFVNERTQKKFVITDSLEKVCQELGWDLKEVEACGGVSDFMHKHEKAGSEMIFE